MSDEQQTVKVFLLPNQLRNVQTLESYGQMNNDLRNICCKKWDISPGMRFGEHALIRYCRITVVIKHDFGHARNVVLDPTALMRIEVALAAMGNLLVQACKLYLALAALDTSDRIAGGTAFRICRADLEHLFPAVIILPAIHSCPPFTEQV
jgi:hypothetical protein